MIKPPNQTCSHTHICLGPMFKAFQKGCRPWETRQQQKTHGLGAWQYCLLDLSGSERLCGKVCSWLNHPIKLVPTQTHMFRVHVWGLPKEWQALGKKPTSKNPWLDCLAILLAIARRDSQWKIMWQSVFMIEPPNETCSHTNTYVYGPCLRSSKRMAGIGKETNKQKPMVGLPGHTAS